MEMDPHQMIEGITIAGRAIGAKNGFIYIRGEYRYVLDTYRPRSTKPILAIISAKISSARDSILI